MSPRRMNDRIARLPRRRLYAAAVVVLCAGVLWRPAGAHLRAASLLARFSQPEAPGFVGSTGVHSVEEHDETVAGFRVRRYVPVDLRDPPGVVIVHGVHFRGIDEPRLLRFARAVAQSGIEVLTPEVRELCDYRIEPRSLETIGAATTLLSERLTRRVGVMGFSFAGGLSLIAAADPRFGSRIAFVVAVGAHDDLGRVLRFFVNNEAPRPDGSTLRMRAHDYGPVVLVYSHAQDFFSAADQPVASDALRLWLHEEFDAARARAAGLSPEGAARIAHVFAHDVAPLAPELTAEIARLEPEFAAVSPSAHLAQIRVPVYLLHGAGDTVIPASETQWLAHDTPPQELRDVLVSRAIEHVELEPAGFGDEVALVHFMGDVLLEAGAAR